MRSMLNNHEAVHSCAVPWVYLSASYDLPTEEQVLSASAKDFSRDSGFFTYFFRLLFDFLGRDIGDAPVVIVVLYRSIEFRLIGCKCFILERRTSSNLKTLREIFFVELTLGFCRAFDSIFVQAESRSRNFSFSFCFSTLYFDEHSSNNLWFISMNSFNAL